jgi:uncharacterized membrane protein
MMYGFGRGMLNLMPLGMIGGACMLVFLALLITIIVLSVRNSRNYRRGCCSPHGMPHDAPPYSGSSNAEQILKERLAKGEIDEAAYESILKKIRE